MSLFDELDLGAEEYSPEKQNGLGQFTSKPSPKPYQPFGGPIQQAPQTFTQPQPFEQPQAPEPQSYNVFSDDELDAYDKAKEDYKYINSYASAANQIASRRKSNYNDFMKTKLKPFFESVGGFGDFDDDDGLVLALDEMEQTLLTTSQQEDGWLGPSDEKIAAGETLKGFQVWSSPNGLRDQYRRLNQERDHYSGIADTYKEDKIQRLEQLTNIPMPAKQVLDEELKARGNTPQGRLAKAAKSGRKSSGKNSDLNAYLDSFNFEQPMYSGFGLSNLDKTDPRTSVQIDDLSGSNQKRQAERLSAAMRGDTQGILSRRQHIAKERQLRDKGYLFSQSGLLDGRPIGMSRDDVDLLDIESMKKMGIEEYRGVPIEQAFLALGGEERFQVAKVLEATRGAYLNYENAQIKWLTGNRDAGLKNKMEEAKEAFTKSLGFAAELGLTDELVEQNEKKGFFARMGDAMSRGSKLNDMSKYSMDFFTNAADINGIDKFIDLAEELGEIPTGSAAQKYQQYKSKGFWDSVSNLLFDNIEAIPELFVESLSSFLPAYLRTGMKTIPGGAAIGFATPVPGGAAVGAKLAARANWGVASFVLEYSGMILEGMQELNIDWQNPKVFAAAWNNEIIRDEIKDKALKKGLPIALMDSISGLMSGRISAGLHHIKGGKLLDGKAWKKSKETYPRFTGFQRAANIGIDVAADTTLGMGGEFLGQAWSKEPGEEWDYNAIVAEGIVGLGPGLLGGAYEYTSTRNLDLSNTPFQYQNVKNTPDGQSGTVNLAGFTNEFNSFNTAQGAASHVINQGNYANPEARNNAAKVLTDLMARLYALNPAEMKDLKLVVADRTPFADKEMEGSYHHDRETDTSVIYLNRNKIGQDPLGVFLHESGHLARKLMISEQKLLDIYQAIGENAQRDSFAQYTLKIPGIRYGKLSESQKSQVDSEWGKMGEMRRAEEWFSYQWASLLAGNNIDASVKTEYQNFLTQVIHPTVEKFIGGKTTGGTKAQQFELNQIILQKMGFNPNGIREDGNTRFGEYYHERPGMTELFLNKKLPIQQMGDEEALNSMMRKVSIIAQTQGLAQAKRVVEATNKILGEKVLPTDMSAYTRRELRSKVLPIADARVAAEDAVATAEVYETLEGEDAKNAVNELVETKEEPTAQGVVESLNLEDNLKKAQDALEQAQADFDRASKTGNAGEKKGVGKKVIKAKQDIKAMSAAIEKAKKLPPKETGQTRKVAKIEKAIDEKEEAVVSEIKQVQNLMPGSEIVDSKDGKFSLKLRLPGTRKALPARIFETREEAEKEEKKFYADERKKLTDISKKVSGLMKLAQNEKEFEKAAAETKKALLARLGKKEATEQDISYGQIIAEMMGLNDLMDNAIFSSSLLAMDLADVSSGKAPDGQRVVDAIEKYNQQVEFATGAIDSRISELELKKKELLLEKQLLQGQITQDVYEKKQKGLTALGSKQAKQGRLPKGKWVVVFRGPQGNWKKWKDGKWVNAPKLDGNKFVKKRLDKNVYRYVAADKTAADKALNEKQRKYVSFWREPEANQAKPQAKAKAKAKPEPRKEKEPEAKKPEPEAKKVDSPRLKQIDSELNEIDKTLTLLREYRHAIEPEKAAIDWKGTPHFSFHKYVGPDDGPNKENKGFDDKNFEPYTLGQLAEYDRDGTPIWQKTYNKKAKRYLWNVVTVSDTQKTLFNYTDWRKHLPDETKKEDTTVEAPENVSDVVVGDIWAQDGYKIVSTNLGGVHGRGLAKQAKDKGFINQSNVDFASSPEFILPPAELFDDAKVITLAVKGKEPKTQKVKGKSFSEQVTGKNVELLSSEVDKLIAFARKKKDEKFYLPYIGLGFGEGNSAEIQPILNKAAKEPNIFLISKDEATVKKYEDSFKPGVRRDATTRGQKSEARENAADAEIVEDAPAETEDTAVDPITAIREKALIQDRTEISKYDGKKQKAKGGMSSGEALDILIASGTDLEKALAARLKNIAKIKSVRVGYIDDSNSKDRGTYFYKKDAGEGGVALYPGSVGLTLLHELMHAVTVTDSTNYKRQNREAVFSDKNMQSLYDAWRKARKGWMSDKSIRPKQDSFGNPISEKQVPNYLTRFDEFLAMLYTDKELQSFLTKVKSDTDNNKSLFTEILDAISNILNFDAKGRTLLEESLRAMDSFMESKSDKAQSPTALGSGIDKSQAFNPFVKGRKMDSKLSWFGNRTVQEYVDILDAVRASAALPEKVGSRRYIDGDRIFFQSKNGTSVAAMMLFRLKEMDKKAGFNGRKITSGSIEDISLAEMSVYELATGRALEILDDRDIRGSKQQRYHQLIERRAYEMSQDIKEYEKLLKAETDPKKKEGIERNIERLGQQLLALYFDYDEAGSFQGEETGGFFPKIHGGKQWSETLTEFLFFKEKEQAVDKILDIWEEDIARDQGAGLGKKSKESRNRPAWGLDAELWTKYTDIYRALLRASGKSKAELKKDLDAMKDAHIERRDEAQRTYQEEYEKKLADQGVQAAKKWDAKVTAPEDYEFFAMGEKSTQQVPAKNDHGSFARGNVDEGVDVISMFAKGRTGTEGFSPERTTFGTGFGSEQASPDLARDLERRLDKAIADKAIEVLKDEKYQDIDLFEITRANGQKLKVKRVGGLWKKANGHVLDKDLEDIAREEFIKNDPKLISQIKGVIAAQDALATSGVTSGGAVSPLQYVEYLLSVARDGAGLKKAILRLQYIPSSKVKDGALKQMPGGPGGGILPYVWKDFVTEVYKLLKINEEPVFTPAKDPKKSGWQNLSEEVTRTIKNKDGKQTRVSEPNTLWTNGVPDVDAMIAQSRKIIQAVYDSGRIMLAPGRGLDEAESNKNSPNASNVLQQDPSVHTSSLEDFIKNDAPEGSLDNMEIDDGGLQKTVQADQQESAALPDEGIKTLKDTDTIPQSFATANDPIASKLEGTETNKKLFNLKKDGKALSLKKVIQEFRTDEVFWNAFGLPMPPEKNFLVYKWAKDLKVHPNYPYLKARILNPGTTSLGSNYSLSSGVPSDSIKAVNALTRMANKVGLGEEGRQDLRDYFSKHKDRFSKQGIISAALDSSRPATSIISKALKDVGIDNKELLDQLDVKGLIQQYFGKTDEIVRQAHLRFIEPIEDALADHGIKSKEFGEYLLARAAPSRNAHIKKLYTEYLNDAKEEKKEAIQEMLDKYGDRMSGISNETAIKIVKEFEQNKSFRAFLKDERAPLQKFYAFNREALRHRAEGGLMRTDSAVDGINEEVAMVKASSSFNWKKDGGSEFMYQENGKDNNYSYAPMQGFEGETETLFDNERAYEVAGKSSTAAGRAWDMPKHKFLFDGSFGRLDENAVAPDPEMVFPVSQSQYYEGAILGQKNMVSTAIGQVFEILRSVAFHGEKAPLGELPYLDLNTVPGGKEILKKLKEDPSIKETTRELFEGKDAVFEKKYEKMVEKKHYEIETKDIEVDGEKVDGMVMARRMINTEFQNNPIVFVYRQNGEPRYIKMKNNERGMRFAAAIKNLRYETLPTFLRGVNTVTRFMASMFTSKNPAFIIPNFVRDLGTAYLHLSEDDKQAFVKNVFRQKRLKGFIGGIFKVEQKKARGEATLMELPKDPEQAKKYAQQLLADNDYEKMYQFAVQAGAKVGYFRTKPVTEMIEDMQKLHEEGGKNKKSERRKIKQMIDTFDSVNTSVENSIRMSAFWSAIENGRSVHEAAKISRNVTVDFNQKGTMTQTLGAFFVFFGASMNSIDRMMTMFQRRGYKRSRNLIAAVAATSFALNIFNRIMDDDDDEAEPGYDRIPSYRRDTMALFSTPGKDNTGYFGIPLPLGYNMFWTMGQTAADFFAKHVMGRGGSGSVEFLERNLTASLNAFNPVGGASLATALVPTSIKPWMEVWANQNFMGSPIRMEDRPFEAPKPAHMMDPKRTQEHWTAISKGINELMGGNDNVKGSLGGLFGSHPLKSMEDSDVRWGISGSQMEHILLGYSGGPGQIVNAIFGGLIWPGLPGTNEDYGKFDANKMPIANRFYRSSTSDASTKNAYYQIRTANKTAERAVKAAKLAGPKEFAYSQQEMKDLLVLSSSVKYADAFKSKVRVEKSKIESSSVLNQDQKFQRIAELEKREHDAYVAVIKKAQALGIS